MPTIFVVIFAVCLLVLIFVFGALVVSGRESDREDHRDFLDPYDK